jgi:cyclophilin family peptidyl-prolyl cis-trans isomerase
MSQRSRSRGGSGRRPKDLRTGPGRASPPPGRAIGVSRQRPAQGRRSRGVDPRLVAFAVAGGILVVLALVLGGFFNNSPVASPGTSVTARGTNCPTSQPAPLAAGETRTVTLTTPKGNIVIKVTGSLSPIAAGNFVALASCGFYDGLVFHRTAALPDGTPFVIQGGDPNGDGSGGPGYTIQDEPVTTTYKRGTVAMARGSQPNSQGSQFFIVLDDKDASTLASANTYAIFGEVTSGMDVADAIYSASPPSDNVPSPIPMSSVTVANP